MPEITDGCRKAAAEIAQIVQNGLMGEKMDFGPGGLTAIIARHTRAGEMAEALDNVAGALDTVLAHYGDKMPTLDKVYRECHLARARARALLTEVDRDGEGGK